MAGKWKKDRFDWGAFSRMMTDVLNFQKKGLLRLNCESENISLRVYDWLQCPMDLKGTIYEKGIELYWTAKDMCPDYQEAMADCWIRCHETDLREFFKDYNLDALKRGKVWKVCVTRPLPNTNHVHVVKYQ